MHTLIHTHIKLELMQMLHFKKCIVIMLKVANWFVHTMQNMFCLMSSALRRWKTFSKFLYL